MCRMRSGLTLSSVLYVFVWWHGGGEGLIWVKDAIFCAAVQRGGNDGLLLLKMLTVS